jgi:hypothetical protein
MNRFTNFLTAIQELVTRGEQLQKAHLIHAHWKDWSVPAKALLTLALGRKDPLRQEFKAICDAVDLIRDNTQLGDLAQSEARKARFARLLEILRTSWQMGLGSQVFVVHGRDEKLLGEVDAVLRRIGVEPIVLAQHRRGSRTVIEQFEKYADVGFAVVLLTGDDEGGLAGVQPQSKRPRQNVIFETGFFVGRLGRDRVCYIREPGVDIPSDLGGVFVLNGGTDWSSRLTEELTAAGYGRL